MKRNYIILLILFFASLFNLAAKEVIICQTTNGCVDRNGDYLCCSIIKNATCDNLTLFDAAGNPWPRGSYECIDIDGAVIIKPLVNLNSDAIWDPNKMQVRLASKDPAIPETVLADLNGIWNNEEGSLQVLQVYVI